MVVLYDRNTPLGAREVTVSVTTTGSEGVSITRDISYTQAAAPPPIMFSSSDLAVPLPASRGNFSAIEIAVTTSGTATDFTVAVTQGGDFASIVRSESPVIVSLTENTGPTSREGIITLTEVGAIPPYTVEIPFTQLGTVPALRVTTRPDLRAPLSSATGTIAVDVALLGGATGWNAAITSDPATFLTSALSGMSGGAGTGVLTITYGQNAGGVREGVVTLTPTGVGGGDSGGAYDYAIGYGTESGCKCAFGLGFYDPSCVRRHDCGECGAYGRSHGLDGGVFGGFYYFWLENGYYASN